MHCAKLIPLTLLYLASGFLSVADANDDYTAQVEKWRSGRVARLTARGAGFFCGSVCRRRLRTPGFAISRSRPNGPPKVRVFARLPSRETKEQNAAKRQVQDVRQPDQNFRMKIGLVLHVVGQHKDDEIRRRDHEAQKNAH
jgi:hypothetical protein